MRCFSLREGLAIWDKFPNNTVIFLEPLINFVSSYLDAEVCRADASSREFTMIETIPDTALPSDFVAYNGPVVFEQNQLCSSVLFIIKKDNIDEGEEVFEVSLAGGNATRSLREKRWDIPTKVKSIQVKIRGESHDEFLEHALYCVQLLEPFMPYDDLHTIIYTPPTAIQFSEQHT